MLSINKKANGIVDNLNKDLAKFQKQTDDALDIFKKTVDKLDLVDEQIDERMALAESQIISLNEIKENLAKRKQSNYSIKAKFMEFIEPVAES